MLTYKRHYIREAMYQIVRVYLKHGAAACLANYTLYVCTRTRRLQHHLILPRRHWYHISLIYLPPRAPPKRCIGDWLYLYL